MKRVRAYTGSDGESHLQVLSESQFDFVERENTRTAVEDATGVVFAKRPDGYFSNFNNAPRRQYVLYLTCSVEIGLGDGSSLVMDPGDILLAEDSTGRGHSSSVVKGGICAFVRLEK
jgi:hypothetical protein